MAEFSDLILKGYTELIPDIPSDVVHFCIGCAKDNPIGLKLRFFGKKEAREVVTRLSIGREYCGFPNFTHGGIITLLMDELMAYAVYLTNGHYGVTKSITIDFKRPVLINSNIFVRAVVLDSEDVKNKTEFKVEGYIHEGNDASDKICAKAIGTLVVLSDERFRLLWKQA